MQGHFICPFAWRGVAGKRKVLEPSQMQVTYRSAAVCSRSGTPPDMRDTLLPPGRALPILLPMWKQKSFRVTWALKLPSSVIPARWGCRKRKAGELLFCWWRYLQTVITQALSILWSSHGQVFSSVLTMIFAAIFQTSGFFFSFIKHMFTETVWHFRSHSNAV